MRDVRKIGAVELAPAAAGKRVAVIREVDGGGGGIHHTGSGAVGHGASGPLCDNAGGSREHSAAIGDPQPRQGVIGRDAVGPPVGHEHNHVHAVGIVDVLELLVRRGDSRGRRGVVPAGKLPDEGLNGIAIGIRGRETRGGRVKENGGAECYQAELIASGSEIVHKCGGICFHQIAGGLSGTGDHAGHRGRAVEHHHQHDVAPSRLADHIDGGRLLFQHAQEVQGRLCRGGHGDGPVIGEGSGVHHDAGAGARGAPISRGKVPAEEALGGAHGAVRLCGGSGALAQGARAGQCRGVRGSRQFGLDHVQRGHVESEADQRQCNGHRQRG